MHSLDLANLVKDRPDSALATLSLHAVTYTNASTSFPSNSWPGLLSMVTGGSPNVTGVIFENSYDHSLSPPASDCSKIGTTVIFDSSIDKNRGAVDGGGGIDPDRLPRGPQKGCTPVFPHNFVRVNTIFEVIKSSGGRTAWCDKHPAYDLVNGPSGTGVDDLFTPEVRSFRGVKNVESYDDLKVAAILNEIVGNEHTGRKHWIHHRCERIADQTCLTSVRESLRCNAIFNTSARCIARLPVLWRICSRQLKPSVTINVSGAAFRTAGNRTRSATACDTSNLSFWNPNGPAIPQHPESGDCSSAPNIRSSASS
jgi:hypothetical protein